MHLSGTRRLACACGAVVLAATSVHAQSAIRYTDAKPSDRAAATAAARPSLPVVQGSLTFYTDRTVFNTAHPGLPVETFSATLVPPNSVVTCTSPFNNATNNACFAPGGIRPGISVVNSGGVDLVVLTPPFFGVPCVSVGPNVFSDASELQFSPPVVAVGLDFESNNGGVPFTLTVFGPGGSLGSTTHSGGIPGAFWGVDTSDPGGISRVTFSAPGDNGELLCNVAFGQPVPVELQSFTIQ
jgi:hypothetical protein